MKFYRFLGGKFEAIVEKTFECIRDLFEGLKMAIKASWENIKEHHYIVWIVLGLIFAYPFIVKLIGG